MRTQAILACTVLLLLVLCDVEARKSSGRRSGGGGWGLGWGSSSSSRSRTSGSSQPGSHGQGSNTKKIGWNVPASNSKPASNTGVKPSAPVPENAAKSSVSNVQSGYNPSGGYPRQPASNPYHTPSNNPQNYNPPGNGYSPYGQGYNPPAGHGYNPPMGHGYNPPVGQSYPNPSFGGPTYRQPYNPSYGQQSFGSPYNPGIGAMPQQTVLLQPVQASRPGIGQLAKEAFVFAGVSAGVNAAVNRILPGGIYGHRSSDPAPAAAAGPHTQITYNNYYNNGTAPSPATDPAAAPAAPAAPAANSQNPPANPAPAAEGMQTSQSSAGTNNAPSTNSGKTNSQEPGSSNGPNPLGYVNPNDDLKKLTESLFEADVNNANKFITVNLQGQKTDDSTSDDAPEPLLNVKSEAYDLPTVKAALALHDNYEWDVKTKETVTSEERREESDFLDKILETQVFKLAMKYLVQKGYIEDDEYEFKDTMKRIWFSQFKRMDGDASSSGFETVFLSEKFESEVIGMHNWIYFAKQEEAKKLNYLGYIKELKFGDKGAILKVRSSVNEIVQPATTIFVGTSPELEMALYTVCFFTHPSTACPVSLGGSQFMIVSNRVNYFGKDIIISGYPDI